MPAMAGPALAQELAELKQARTRLRAKHKQQVRAVQSEISRLQAELQRLDADFEQQDAALDEKHQTLFLNILLGPPAPLQAPGPAQPSPPAPQETQDCSPEQHVGPVLAAVRPLNPAEGQCTVPEPIVHPAEPGHVSNEDAMDEDLDAVPPTVMPSADGPAAEILPAQPEIKDPMSANEAAEAAALRLEAMRAALAKSSNTAAQSSDRGADTSMPDGRQTPGKTPAMFHYSLPVIPSAQREILANLLDGLLRHSHIE